MLDYKWTKEWRLAIWWKIRFFGLNCWKHLNWKQIKVILFIIIFLLYFHGFLSAVFMKFVTSNWLPHPYFESSEIGLRLHKSTAPEPMSLNFWYKWISSIITIYWRSRRQRSNIWRLYSRTIRERSVSCCLGRSRLTALMSLLILFIEVASSKIWRQQ